MSYINREALQEALERKKAGPANRRFTEGYNDAIMRVKSMVSKAPDANVTPIIQGKWESQVVRKPFVQVLYRCSKCGYLVDRVSNYCPNCGAKMTGGFEDGE